MTTLGSPSLSSQSVSGFSGRKGPKNLETNWDDNPEWIFSKVAATAVRRDPNETELFKTEQAGEGEYAGTDALVVCDWSSDVCSSDLTDWDDNLGKPIPIRFGVFWPKRAKKP